MSRTRRIALTTCGAVTALAALFSVALPEAEAAKVRKKPPQQALTTPEPDADASGEYEDPDAPAPAESARPAARTEPDPTPAIPYPRSGLICLYGQESDPKTKKVHCLSPEELDPPRLVIVNTRAIAEKLGMLSRTASLPMPSGEAPEPPRETPAAEPESPYEARVVRISFENGAVGGALHSLRGRTDDMAKCVEDHGGLRDESARLKLLFFVRGNKKASGMITASARNIPVPVVRCIRKVIQEGTIGHPSRNPVGVKVLIELKEND